VTIVSAFSLCVPVCPLGFTVMSVTRLAGTGAEHRVAFTDGNEMLL
jgi:hypothetical protein